MDTLFDLGLLQEPIGVRPVRAIERELALEVGDLPLGVLDTRLESGALVDEVPRSAAQVVDVAAEIVDEPLGGGLLLLQRIKAQARRVRVHSGREVLVGPECSERVLPGC